MPQPTTQRRWSEDTRIAFLLALRLTGTATRAAAEIGRQPAVCYKVRERDPGFAAQWDAIVAEQRRARRLARLEPDTFAGSSAGLPPDAIERDAAGHRVRRDGLGRVKRRAFLRVLAESGKVDTACARVGVSDTAVYRLRAADADFAAGWDRALATSAPVLEQVVWERAVEGWEEPVFRNGVQVGTRRRFSETLLRQLVIERGKAVAIADDPAALAERAHEAAQAAGGFFSTPATRAETDAAIMKALAVKVAHRDRTEIAAAEAAGLFALVGWVRGGGASPELATS